MMIKVCGITRREDAEAAAGAGASAIGFVFHPRSPRYVSAERAAELGAGLPVWKVGVFVDETPASIEAVMRAAALDVIQIYGGDAPAGARLWRAYRVAQATPIPSHDRKGVVWHACFITVPNRHLLVPVPDPAFRDDRSVY